MGAVASLKGFTFSGFFAWLLWCLVHILSLVGFRKRVFVVFSWLWSYLSFTKSARLITGDSRDADPSVEKTPVHPKKRD
ncbi:NADH dehydrogenase [Geoalkalibacter ferrihydriticus]|uniref:NADH dehydrogenase n=2 Tax=Geoalkalibacter ferrihydriticus TaxID=392333 RepID=A0A0C2HUI7_9BACT|nr:hypothetical protein [Geoalkalibacter ferrihydriticus]KIH76492.1 hypothetical protein GFER_09905 [Geoalkalibacter ferrihydriticus DSM 17813]SDL98094.1 NADH dehydrogenase [Geoalkalibacter ferrihydriticus]